MYSIVYGFLKYVITKFSWLGIKSIIYCAKFYNIYSIAFISPFYTFTTKPIGFAPDIYKSPNYYHFKYSVEVMILYWLNSQQMIIPYYKPLTLQEMIVKSFLWRKLN